MIYLHVRKVTDNNPFHGDSSAAPNTDMGYPVYNVIIKQTQEIILILYIIFQPNRRLNYILRKWKYKT